MAKKSSASFRQEQLHRMKPGNIMLTEKIKKELKLIKHRKIDLSDESVPEISDWDEAISGKFYRPIKKQITIRLDIDVLEWFKHTTMKYQTLINRACREYMVHHKKNRKNIKQKHV